MSYLPSQEQALRHSILRSRAILQTHKGPPLYSSSWKRSLDSPAAEIKATVSSYCHRHRLQPWKISRESWLSGLTRDLQSHGDSLPGQGRRPEKGSLMGIQPEHPEFLAPSQLCVPTIEFPWVCYKQGFLILRAKPKKNIPKTYWIL